MCRSRHSPRTYSKLVYSPWRTPIEQTELGPATAAACAATMLICGTTVWLAISRGERAPMIETGGPHGLAA